IVGQYKINDRWEVGASFSFQSGQSYTGVTSRFNSQMPGEDEGSGVTVPAQRYGMRLPPSHQLNINANYNTTLFGLPARLLTDNYLPQYVIEGYMIVDQPIEGIKISRSQSVVDTFKLSKGAVPDADVRIIVNGESLALQYRADSGAGSYYYPDASRLVEPNT